MYKPAMYNTVCVVLMLLCCSFQMHQAVYALIYPKTSISASTSDTTLSFHIFNILQVKSI